MKWAGDARLDEMKNAYKILVEEPEARVPFWGSRRRYEVEYCDQS
jgi:hypothetical protein